jgi:hypothetical protein
MREYLRTYKALYAICKGIPIVKYEWVEICENYEKIIDHEKYKFDNIPKIYDAIMRVRNG